MSKPSYYIWASDPHGTGQAWINLIQEAQQTYPHAQTVFGGDYIDGCPHADDTVDFVKDQVGHDHAIALMGNHELIMQQFVEQDNRNWYYNGAKTTIRSFYGRGFAKERTRHLLQTDDRYHFLSHLPIIYETPHLIFVHAGIACWTKNWRSSQFYQSYLPLFETTAAQKFFYLWAREDYWFHDPTVPNGDRNADFITAHNYTGKTIVSGHTPTSFLWTNYEDGTSHFPDLNIPYDTERYLDPTDDPNFGQQPCPVKIMQYTGEAPRYFTDDGCHGHVHRYGNVCVFNQAGQLVQIFNHDQSN